MISYYNGDLLESGCDIICHQVNLQGIMGGGLALQIATKYPSCEEEYKKYCKENPCGVNFVMVKRGNLGFPQYIANCFSQNEDFTTNYEWLKNCVKTIKEFAHKYGLQKVGIPYKYGCGIAFGDWTVVEKIWIDEFENGDIDLQIWKLEG